MAFVTGCFSLKCPVWVKSDGSATSAQLGVERPLRKMGDAIEIVCPYCSTLFRFDPSLGAQEADPADCAFGDMD
jgi:hypothetical protein